MKWKGNHHESQTQDAHNFEILTEFHNGWMQPLLYQTTTRHITNTHVIALLAVAVCAASKLCCGKICPQHQPDCCLFVESTRTGIQPATHFWSKRSENVETTNASTDALINKIEVRSVLTKSSAATKLLSRKPAGSELLLYLAQQYRWD